MKKVVYALCILLGPALAQEQLDEEEVKRAIERGVAWLEAQQVDDGSFGGIYANDHPLGETALGILTLTKCGSERETEAIRKGFEYMFGLPLDATYDVGLLLMSLEALYAPTPEQVIESKFDYVTQERRNFKKLSPRPVQAKAQNALNWLFGAQNYVWGYGQHDKNQWHDHSNSQYAMLGIGSGHRLMVDGQYDKLYRALDHILAAQEETGPEVEWFSVPAADHSFSEIRKLEKELIKDRREGENTQDRTVERINEFHETAEQAKMFARGFAYFSLETGRGPGGPRGSDSPPPGPGGAGGSGPDNMSTPTQSMTSAGLAMLVICKSVLEGDRKYDREYASAVDQAIRDSAAWLALNFDVYGPHQYYTMYGVERAGILTGCHYFGEHDWYVEMGRFLLRQQNPDGSWTEHRGGGPRGGGAGAGGKDITNTCFALLFLKRATVPLVPELPKRPVTGE